MRARLLGVALGLIAALAAAPALGETTALSVDAAGWPVWLDLEVRVDLLHDAARDAPAVARGDDVLYTGTVRGYPGSWVRAARIDGRWSGVFSDGLALWVVDDDAGGKELHAHAVETYDAPRTVAVTTRFLNLKLVLDTQFQALYGSASASRAGAMANVADGLYRAQTAIGITGVSLLPLASNGTMTATDAATLLGQFQVFMTGAGAPNPGEAHLLTARDLDSTTIGLAFQGTVCTATGVGLDQATFTLAEDGTTLAHELGHGFGASHDSVGNACPQSGFVMQAVTPIGGTPPASFSSCSLTYFSQFLLANPTPCLLTPPPDAIFSNGYE